MSAKILAAMKRIDASLTLIAGKAVNGEYDSVEAIQSALGNVRNAVKTAKSAQTKAAAPAKQGSKGIVAMATDAYDTLLGSIAQTQIKAELLDQALSADLEELEKGLGDEEPTEDIDYEDFSDEDASSEADAESDTIHEEHAPSEDETPEEEPAQESEEDDGEGESDEEESEETPEGEEVPVDDPEEAEAGEHYEGGEHEGGEEEVTDLGDEGGEDDFDAGAELDELMEEEDAGEDVEGTLDATLAEFTGGSALDSDLSTASDSKADLKSTVVASQKSDASLDNLWNFKSV